MVNFRQGSAKVADNEKLQAPFPWFGGKSRVADVVWRAFGDVKNYVEPFFGSGAVYLNAPEGKRVETVNDADGFVANFWRSVQHNPDAVAAWADWPVNETDLISRHSWLVTRKARLKYLLEGDPDFHDVKIAGWWLWGICNWIGSGWCAGEGPWINTGVDIVDARQLPHLSAGQGVNRQLPHMDCRGINHQVGCGERTQFIWQWMNRLSARMRDTRVACGDWSRVVQSSCTFRHGLTGVFLDPPYGVEDACTTVYGEEMLDVAGKVRQWCIQNGGNPLLRIALCGYDTEHGELEQHGWSVHAWKTAGGYSSQNSKGNANCKRERIWFSPACVAIDKSQPLLAEVA
jgi:DNA adenine methylase